MNLLIVGNIASGKSTLAQGLRQKAPEHFQKYCSIDNFRKSYSDGTFAGEFNAWAVMLKQIQNASQEGDGIFEFSGTGKNAWFVRSTMDYSKQHHNANWRVIYCSCDPKIIQERCVGREYDVPIPYNFNNINSSIDFIGSELAKRANTNYFNSPELFVRTDQLNPEEAVDYVLTELRL
jgi:adenylate kinase family enzyme